MNCKNKIKQIWNDMKTKINDFGTKETIIFFVYVICVVIISICHEFSQDETQSWLIARDLGPIGILSQMRYEGHSFFWYYLLLPFAKLGFSIEIQKTLPLIFSIFTVYIILKKSPFHLITKLLLIFNPAMIYYSLFARPYCMIPFFLVLIASIYKEKEFHPYQYAIYIGLLAHTHVIMVPVCIMLILFFWGKQLYQKKGIRKLDKPILNSLFLVIFLVLIYVIIIIFGYRQCEIITLVQQGKSYQNYLSLIGEAWLRQSANLFGQNKPIYYSSMYPPTLLEIFQYILIGIVLLFCFIGMKRNLKQGLIFFMQYLFVLVINAFFWFPLPTRSFMIIYTLMFWVWTYRFDYSNFKHNYFVEIAFILLLLITIPKTYSLIHQDLTKNYSSGKETATFIEENIKENSIIANVSTDFSQLVVGYLKKDQYKFYSVNSKRYVTYNTWDKKHAIKNKSSQFFNHTILNLQQEDKDVYILEPKVYNMSTSVFNIYNKNASESFTLEYIYSSDLKKLIDDQYIHDNVSFNIYKVHYLDSV